METLQILHRNNEETCITFVLLNEDHTLGNALRFMIMKNPKVQFCGYAIPHPSERTVHLRIQMYDGSSAIDALEKGLQDLREMLEHVHLTFEDTVNTFKGELAV